jgi:hypothetical protein
MVGSSGGATGLARKIRVHQLAGSDVIFTMLVGRASANRDTTTTGTVSSTGHIVGIDVEDLASRR